LLGFRPLSGIRVFRTDAVVERLLVAGFQVSVPCRGLGSFGLDLEHLDRYVVVPFPSPVGD